jgi:DNA-binding response OmpR family regulator
MQHMRILHICPTARLDHPLAPESLQYLGHRIDRCGAEQLPALDRESPTPDVVIVDACLDLSLAPRIAEALSAAGITAAIVVVLGEGGLATASAKWGVADFLLTTAGPAEVEARLRVARDRHLSAQSGGTGTGGRLGAGFSTQPWGVPGTARGLSGSGAAGVRGGDGGPWNAEGEPMIVVTGTLRIDETAFTADLGGRSLDLTYREFALLKFFAMHPERVFTRDEILLAVWGDDYFGGTRTVDVHVRRLRAKLGKDLENAIHTVRNVGYRFSADSVTGTEDGDSEPPQAETQTGARTQRAQRT